MVTSKELKAYIQTNKDNKGDDLDMCKAITDLIEDGRIEGNEEGEDRLATLINKLVMLDRIDDIQRVSVDKVYREKLYIQYGIKKAEKKAKTAV